MKPLTHQTVYVPTYEKILFTPRDDVRAIIEETKESVVVNKPSGVTDVIFNWQSVKEQSLYCFTKEEMQEYEEGKDNFSIAFAIWCLYDPQAKAYIESKVSAAKLLSLYKDRPFINPDANLQ